MPLHPQVLEEMEEEDLDKGREALDEEQASADVVIDVAKVDEPLDIASTPALQASAEDENMLQSTYPDRDMSQVSAAIEARVSISLPR